MCENCDKIRTCPAGEYPCIEKELIKCPHCMDYFDELSSEFEGIKCCSECSEILYQDKKEREMYYPVYSFIRELPILIGV